MSAVANKVPDSDPNPTETRESEPRARHRPSSLDLRSSNLMPGKSKEDLESFALKIVSPGLPPLNRVQQSTVTLSKSIELQQKHLIAQRTNESPSTSTLPDLELPMTKRLQRGKLPAPLNIVQGYSQPIIQSAPIRSSTSIRQQQQQYLQMYQQMKAGFPGATGPYTGAYSGARLARTPLHSSRRTAARAYPSPYAQMYQHQQLQQMQLQMQNTARAGQRTPIVDVFSNSTKRFAPGSSQPLSAQGERFSFRTAPDSARDAVASRELPDEGDDVENVAISPEDETPTPAPDKKVKHKGKIVLECGESEQVFEFEFLTERELGDKANWEKWRKVCETTWNEYEKMT
ncbi:hypothetical protein BABINDRAFT_161453 [Babjeviella inositovora NRRL Y-12698]|uniref:Uncharacterized protein n=1 Tax=Babjeviella inositovora NRRL Y-12698 TaxID=984486 RepID=A0A1E3QQ12_9ASCO|nr:uncharacterized protein BABINDRAFT_161453 [Babjeviella inositovora NRRL Y-12698]ODQ79750.1 hypothetical protein BABINDRAFT_161453 [Babjeviella inositovora NRRL Y-12698]